MYYLIITIQQDIQGQEHVQSNTRFETLDEAITQWHVALSSYRQKETTLKVACSILNEDHNIQKREVFVKPQPEMEETEQIEQLND